MKLTKNQTDITSIIASASLGTLIQWYDFYLSFILAPIMGAKFFPAETLTSAWLSTLATVGAGFVVRPFGALFFGRLGDLIGRKYTFLVTLVLMGSSTFVIGAIPTYESIGWLSSLMILILRLLQGLAVGGEYGGAVVYVAEYSHIRQRGFTTSWIQATASLGFFLSLLVILTIKRSMTDLQFNDWGWRLPFLLSILLVGISFFIRLKMEESPLFRRLSVKEDTSQNPLEETLRDPTNFRLILMSLFAVVMGSGVVVYTIIYAYQFLLRACRVDSTQTDNWICIAFLLGSIFFIFFGWLSDKIGRKPVLLTGMGLAILFTKPIFKEFYKMANPQKSELLGEKPNLSISLLKKQVKKDTLGVQLPAYPIYVIDTINKTSLVFYTVDTVKVFSKTALYKDSTIVTSFKKETFFADSTTRPKNYKPVLNKTVLLGRSSLFYLFGYLSILGVFGAMVSGPLGAFLVDLYPTKIRCTSLSFPYHVGNGVFGGLIPLFATILYEYSKTKENPLGDPFAGLDYPMMVAFISLLIGTFFMPRNSKERENIGGNREYQF